jgi:two-component system response regulator CpxR
MRSLLVDDDRSLCNLLESYLVTAGFTVDQVHCGSSALSACRRQIYDIVLLDVMLPQIDGYQVLSRLRRVSQVPVIMLTAKGDEPDRVKGLDAGADDYMAKPFSSRELVARMKALLRRTQPDMLFAVEQVGDLRFQSGHNHVDVGGREVRLTSVEALALRVLCSRAGAPVARDHLYRVVLQRDNSPYDRSLDTHISNLRGTLGSHDDGKPRITAVRGVGYQYCP